MAHNNVHAQAMQHSGGANWGWRDWQDKDDAKWDKSNADWEATATSNCLGEAS